MAVFSDDDARHTRIDYATLVSSGLASVDVDDVEACRRWLAAHGYAVVTIDCRGGPAGMSRQFNDLLRWSEQFGYEYDGRAEGFDLDALHDGFEFAVPDEGGLVLELDRPDRMQPADLRWLCGVLEIASEYSRAQLCRGRRFFTTLLVARDAGLIGRKAYAVEIPVCWWEPGGRPFVLRQAP